MLLEAADPFPWQALLGRGHVTLLHLPLGLLPALFVLEFGAALFRRPVPRGPILALAWLCAICGGLAVASGLLLAGEGGYDEEFIPDHKIAGIVLGSLCVLCALLAFAQKRVLFRIALLLACIVMVPTGHLGGAESHGGTFLLAPYQEWRAATNPAPEPEQGTTPQDSQPTTTETPPEGVADLSEFQRVIMPIFERTCNSCHNEEKTKGELLLTTVEGIQKGGEYGPVVVPGKPDESELLVRCELPLDDEDHMPPKKKEEQPTAAEVAALRAWIEKGAPYDE